jgi:hypothetical protein
MEEFDKWLTELGLIIIPYSFAIYFPYRWLEYIWQKGYNRLIKAIWYFALGLGYLTKNFDVNYVVTFICFIEAWDLMFQQFEIHRKRKQVSR